MNFPDSFFYSIKHPQKIKVVEMNNYIKTYSESHNFTQSYETLKLRNYAHQNEIQFKIFRVAINDTSSLCGVHKLLIAPNTIRSVSCGIIVVHIVYMQFIYCYHGYNCRGLEGTGKGNGPGVIFH